MNITDTPIEGLKIIEPAVFGDDRGFFMETYNGDQFREAGLPDNYPQDNHSRSVKNTLRGLHFQTNPGQAKLVRTIIGEIYDVAVDIRPDSATFGKWFGISLSSENKKMLFIPTGFAHGFCVISDFAEVCYKVSSLYNPETEAGISWDDPEVAVDWPVKKPLLSERDKNNPTLKAYLKSQGAG